MREQSIKKWDPIIEKLDPTSLLTKAEREDLCVYSENLGLILINSNVSMTFPGTGNKIFGENEDRQAIMPMMLRILFKLLPKLRENNIPYSFIDTEFNSAKEIKFENNTVSFEQTTDFEIKYVSLKLDTDVLESIKLGIGIDLINNCQNFLVEVCVEELFKYAKQCGEFVMRVGGNNLSLVAEKVYDNEKQPMAPVMCLTFQLKKIK